MNAIRNLARQFIAKHNLSPPVHVEEIIAGLANVSYEDDMPPGVDAILVSKAGIGNRVFVHRDRPESRIRFTLGHEIGHIVIPWHYGNMYCQTFDISNSEREFEAEADEFSSQILLPRDWLRDSIQGATSPADIANATSAAVQDAKVSLAAAIRAVVDVCDDPVHLVTERDGSIEYSASSDGWSRPEVISRWSLPGALDALRNDSRIISSARYVSGQTLYVMIHEGVIEGARPTRPSQEILRELVAEYLSEEDRTFALKQIAGLVGTANNRATDRTEDSIFSALEQRCANRRDYPQYLGMMSDPRYAAFLRAKAHELSLRSR